MASKRARVVSDSDSDSDSGSGSGSDAVKVPPQETDKGWRPRMSVSWDDLVKPLVKLMPSGHHRGVPPIKDLGKPFPGGTNVRMFVTVPVFSALLRGYYTDVLSGFDVDGKSFIGWIDLWQWYNLDAARLWLATPVRDPAHPRVFTSHDYDHWMRKTWTFQDVLLQFNNSTWLVNMAAAVKAGVGLGTFDTPEQFSRFVQPFTVEDGALGMDIGDVKNPAYLRKVLDVVLTAPVDRLHWEQTDFKTFKPEKRHKWAVPTMIWFQKQLENRLEIQQAIAAATQYAKAEAEAKAKAEVLGAVATATETVVAAAGSGSGSGSAVDEVGAANVAKHKATIKAKMQGLLHIAPNWKHAIEDSDFSPANAQRLASALTTLEHVFNKVVEGWHRGVDLPEAETKMATAAAMHDLLDAMRYKAF